MKKQISDALDASLETIKSSATSIGESVSEASRTTYEAGKSASQAVGKIVGTTAELVGDLNGDGKVDIEDAKIAIDKAKSMVNTAADETAKLGKEVMQSELVKDVAPYAAIGAVITIPIPFIGPAIGAALGAGLGLFKNATRKK
jgi:hypothetical protein